MRSVRIHHTGGPEALQLDDLDLPAPGPGEARVRHEAIGVNFIDTYHRSGLYPLPALPHGIGVEAAGVVEAIGEGVEGVTPGQRVAYTHRPPGCYAEARNVPGASLVPLPDAVSAEVAATLMVKGLTAETLLRRVFRVEPGHTVLVHAAAGGMGLLLCQWAAALGATVIGTVSTEAKAALAAAHGCAHPILYTREDFVARARALTGGLGVHVVYDGVGRTTFEGSLDALRRRGTLVSFGQASGAIPPFDIGGLARRGSLFLTRPSLFDWIATRDELLACAAATFDALKAGHITSAPSLTLPLAEAVEAHRRLEGRETTGAMVLVP